LVGGKHVVFAWRGTKAEFTGAGIRRAVNSGVPLPNWTVRQINVRRHISSTKVAAAAAGLREYVRSWNEGRCRCLARALCRCLAGNPVGPGIYSRRRGCRGSARRSLVLAAQPRITRAAGQLFGIMNIRERFEEDQPQCPRLARTAVRLPTHRALSTNRCSSRV
jgi:hypothetical protein